MINPYSTLGFDVLMPLALAFAAKAFAVVAFMHSAKGTPLPGTKANANGAKVMGSA